MGCLVLGSFKVAPAESQYEVRRVVEAAKIHRSLVSGIPNSNILIAIGRTIYLTRFWVATINKASSNFLKHMLNLKHITYLTFDCYGTLIDWENGILQALQPLLQAHRAQVSPEDLLRLYVSHEAVYESKSWRPYRQILREISAAIGAELGITFSQTETDMLPGSISKWPPFSDTVPALRRLQQHFPLVILSNIDDALFAETQKHLQITFANIITAEQLRSYKPAPAHFHEALRRLKVEPSQILHVAQSLYHDHVPARDLGISTAWINRPSRLPGVGLAPAASVQPDITVPDLAALADILDRSRH